MDFPFLSLWRSFLVPPAMGRDTEYITDNKREREKNTRFSRKDASSRTIGEQGCHWRTVVHAYSSITLGNGVVFSSKRSDFLANGVAGESSSRKTYCFEEKLASSLISSIYYTFSIMPCRNIAFCCMAGLRRFKSTFQLRANRVCYEKAEFYRITPRCAIVRHSTIWQLLIDKKLSHNFPSQRLR